MEILLFRYIWEWTRLDGGFSKLKQYSIASSKSTVSRLSKSLHRVAQHCLNYHGIPMVGGVGRKVEIDESVFVRRKASFQCSSMNIIKCSNSTDVILIFLLQYNRGRIVQTRWVLGMVDTSGDSPKSIFYVVPNRSAATLIPLIRHHVRPGSTVHTDCWPAYNSLSTHCTHQTVNHSRFFVDPISGQCTTVVNMGQVTSWWHIFNTVSFNPFAGAHTNTIEGEWSRAKQFVKKVQRTADPVILQRNLNTYMWHCWYAKAHPGGAFPRMLTDISHIYKV